MMKELGSANTTNWEKIERARQVRFLVEEIVQAFREWDEYKCRDSYQKRDKRSSTETKRDGEAAKDAPSDSLDLDSPSPTLKDPISRSAATSDPALMRHWAPVAMTTIIQRTHSGQGTSKSTDIKAFEDAGNAAATSGGAQNEEQNEQVGNGGWEDDADDADDEEEDALLDGQLHTELLLHAGD
jgi:hypothetical protein